MTLRLFSVFAAVAMGFGLNAQTRPAFDAASVKPVDPADGTESWMQNSQGEFAIIGSLRSLIRYAWDIEDFRIEGGPKWLDADKFRIDAKPGGPQAKLMLRTLLAGRFKLAVHNETKQFPAYALVIGKNGSKLVKAGILDNGPSSGRGMLRGAMDMPALAKSLSAILGRNVIDQTGLSGSYKFSLRWTPDDQSANATGTSPPSIVTAIQEQLGLKLESTRGPVEILVIDHAEKPSAN
jgi:uncharacterized protein (TIGR03435 family)